MLLLCDVTPLACPAANVLIFDVFVEAIMLAVLVVLVIAVVDVVMV